MRFDKATLGSRLREAREKKGLSQKQLAELTEGQLSASGIAGIERGENGIPSGFKMMALCEALDCSPYWITGMSEEPGQGVDGIPDLVGIAHKVSECAQTPLDPVALAKLMCMILEMESTGFSVDTPVIRAIIRNM